jgi:acyl carrier protein
MAQLHTDTPQKITEILAQLLEKDKTVFTPATQLADVGVGEFDLIELVMKLEDEFGVLLEDSEIAQVETLQDVIELVGSKKK